jgi:hypothetical protein
MMEDWNGGFWSRKRGFELRMARMHANGEGVEEWNVGVLE